MIDYLHNTNGNQFVDDVFPGAHENYREEKSRRFYEQPTRALGFLDAPHRARLLEAVRKRELNARRLLK